jgi:uncharacterized protein YqjF (DUF2071 family)
MWLMAQVWHDLLFAHWPVDAELLRPRLPAGVELDLYEGQAWLGVVPFRMSGVRARFLPALPGLSAFPELNVRTYAVAGGRPGVFFLSLDAANTVTVAAARRFYHLPYYRAEMACRSEGDTVIYSCRRTSGEPAAEFRGNYGPTGPAYRTRAGDLDHWLTERHCLYTADGRGRAVRVDIRHDPWPLQPAWARIEANTMADACSIRLPVTPALLHFSRRLDVVAWLPRRV